MSVDRFSLPLLDALFREAPFGLGVFDTDLRHVRVNGALADLNGFAPAELIGRTPAELHGELGAQAEVLYREVLETGTPITGMEVSGSTASEPDRPRHWSLHYFPVRDDGEIVGLCVVVIEITARVEAERRLVHRATHDTLTQLPRRELFLDRLQHALARLERHSATLAVLFGDVDRLKEVNDTLGHAAGDSLIAAVATRLQGDVRSEDTVARWGGDEFVVLLEDVEGEHEVRALSERLCRAVATPLELAGQQVVPRITLGFAMTGEPVEAQAMIDRADAAMYAEKPG